MSDLTTDEVRDTWVDNQLVGIPTAHAVRLVPGLQVHFDRWLGRERQQARHEVLTDLRAKVEGMRDQSLEAFRSRPHQQHMGTMASTLERVLALIEEAQND